MGKQAVSIEYLLKGLKEAEGLLNEHLTPDIEAKMSPEDLEKLQDMRKLTGVDLPNASKEIERINMKYKR